MNLRVVIQIIIKKIILPINLIKNLIPYIILSIIYSRYFGKYQTIIYLYNQINVLFFYTQNYPQIPYSLGIVLATAYFPLNKSKHTLSNYDEWLKRFFNIINCKVLFYTPKKNYDHMYRSQIINSTANRIHLINFNFTYNDIFEIPVVRNLTQAYAMIQEIDREKDIHNPYLYAIWNCKIWILREATLIYPEERFYFWIDSGCVRETIYGSMFNKYGSFCNSTFDDECHHLSFPKFNFVDDILHQSAKRPLEMCMFQVDRHKFVKYPKKKANLNIFEGVFFGTKKGIDKFYKAFWEVHDNWLRSNIFCGKDQEIYNFVVENYFKKIEFYIFPTYTVSRRCNKWFAFISAFSTENPLHIPYNIYHLSKYLKF